MASSDSSQLVDRYVLLDFDRCLANTELLYRTYIELVQKDNAVLADEINTARADVEAKGGSFDVLSYLKLVKSRDDLARFHEQFVRHARAQNMLNDGATELLATLRERSIPFGILTYGSYDWQFLKLCACELDTVSHLITEVSGKGRLLSTWVTKDKRIKLPQELGGYNVGSLVMVDDKAREFEGMPVDLVKGYVLRAGGDALLPSQRGDVPQYLTVVRSLRDIVM